MVIVQKKADYVNESSCIVRALWSWTCTHFQPMLCIHPSFIYYWRYITLGTGVNTKLISARDGLLHAWTSLSTGKGPPVQTGQECGWAPHMVWTTCRQDTHNPRYSQHRLSYTGLHNYPLTSLRVKKQQANIPHYTTISTHVASEENCNINT